MTMADPATWFAVHEFLAQEAAMLDERNYAAWLELVSADIVYRVTVPLARDIGAETEPVAVIDEELTALRFRVTQISDPRLTRAESPPSLTRRLIGNLRVVPGETENEVVALCNLLVHRCRPNLPEGALYAGQRRDVLRRQGETWRIARRDVALDHAVLQRGALTILL
jgi:3-phenylpropionate/cinnamic acid dioxygenase small subunit